MKSIIFAKTEIDKIAGRLLEEAGPKKKWAFQGDMGAGKTTLIKSICQQLGVEEEEISSPTFSLVNEYEGKEGPIRHIDLYRLEQFEEALDIGLEEVLEDLNYAFIEWPELIESLLPADTFRLKIEALDESNRKILFL